MDQLDQLNRIEAKLDRLIKPESPVVDLDEVQFLTKCESRSAVHRFLQEFKIEPFHRGRYRRLDIMNAVGRRVLQRMAARKAQLKADVAHEAKPEGRNIEPTYGNFHD